MKSHEGNGSRLVVDVVGGCHKRHFVEEVWQLTFRIVALEFLGNVYQFVEVFNSRFILRVAAGFQSIEQAGTAKCNAKNFVDGCRFDHGFEIVQKIRKLQNGIGDFWAKTHVCYVGQNLSNREVLLLSKLRDLSFRSIADSTLWNVQNPTECEVVFAVRNCHQIAEGVFDFSALVELRATNHAVGERRANENFF